MAALEVISSEPMAGGEQQYLRHFSDETGTQMTFSAFLPPQAKDGPVPVLFWLSGLTCTAENFTVKAEAQQHAADGGRRRWRRSRAKQPSPLFWAAAAGGCGSVCGAGCACACVCTSTGWR